MGARRQLGWEKSGDSRPSLEIIYLFCNKKVKIVKVPNPITYPDPKVGVRHMAGCFYLIVRMRHRAKCLTPTSGPGYIIEPRNILSGCTEV